MVKFSGKLIIPDSVLRGEEDFGANGKLYDRYTYSTVFEFEPCVSYQTVELMSHYANAPFISKKVCRKNISMMYSYRMIKLEDMRSHAEFLTPYRIGILCAACSDVRFISQIHYID